MASTSTKLVLADIEIILIPLIKKHFCLYCLKLCLLDRDSVGFSFLRIISDHFKLAEDSRKVELFYINMLLQKDQDLIAEEKIKEILIGQ